MAKTLVELHALIPVAPDALARETTALRERQRAYQLKELRTRAGFTQANIAQAMEVGQNSVSQIESGGAEHSRLDTLRKYAEALGGQLKVEIEFGDTNYRIA